MRRRLYFLLPDFGSARNTADDLLLARVEDRHMHFLTKRGVDLGEMHEASFLQKTDHVHGALSGFGMGGFCALLAGIVIFWLQPFDLRVSPMFILGMTLFGALFGLWTGSLVGSSVPNSRLQRFQQAIEEGRILLMVDVPRGRIEEIQRLITRRHPEANPCGLEPAIPAFP